MSHRIYPATASRYDLALMEQAGHNIERACSILSANAEGFDGERTIEASAHLALRRRLGFPTAEAERKLAEANAEEDRMIQEYLASRR